MSSTSDEISGKIKKTVGKLTNNKELEAQGSAEETKGKVKGKINDAFDKVSAAIDDKK